MCRANIVSCICFKSVCLKTYECCEEQQITDLHHLGLIVSNRSSPKLCMLPCCIVPADSSSDCPPLRDAHQPANDYLHGSKSCLNMSPSYLLGHSASVYNTADLQLQSQQGAQSVQHMAQPTWWGPHLTGCEQVHELDVYSSNGLKVTPQF